MRLLNVALTSLLIVAGSATAQSFNIDIEHIAGNQGSASGGAASGQTGFWNRLTYNLNSDIPPTVLNDLAGLPTGVIGQSFANGLSANLPGTCLGWGAPEIGLYDGAVGMQGFSISMLGLQAGTYQVFVYYKSDVAGGTSVAISGAGVIGFVAGNCPPAPQLHGNPATYTAAMTTITAGSTLTISLGSAMIETPFGISGIQVVQLPAGPQPVGTNYCAATNNSTGGPALISATATLASPNTASVSANDLNLSAATIPAGNAGLFFFGPAQTQVPFGNGFLCVTGGISRLALTNADPTGTMTSPVDFTAAPGSMITAGSTWNFQGWYRDPAAGGAFFNTTDGLEIMFGL